MEDFLVDEADVWPEELLRSGGTGRALFRSFLWKCSFALSYLSFSFLCHPRMWCSYILELDLRIKPRLPWSTMLRKASFWMMLTSFVLVIFDRMLVFL